MHIIHNTEQVLPAVRGPGLLARAVAAFLAWQLRDMERRLTVNLNPRLREDSGLGPTPREIER